MKKNKTIYIDCIDVEIQLHEYNSKLDLDGNEMFSDDTQRTKNEVLCNKKKKCTYLVTVVDLKDEKNTLTSDSVKKANLFINNLNMTVYFQMIQ